MFLKHSIIAALLMLATLGFRLYISHGENIHPNKDFDTFPAQIGEWTGTKKLLTKEVLDILQVDDYALYDYRDSKGIWMNLYVGFYQSQREGEQIHSPKHCMPGAGWGIIQDRLEDMDFPGHSENKAIRLDLQKGSQKELMLYWFHSRGRIISSEYMQKVYLVIDSITRHRTDGSFVRLTTPVVLDEATALKRLKSFARQLMPILDEYIPS